MSPALLIAPRLRRALAALAAVVVLAPAGLPAVAAAQQDTSAVAVNTKDGSSVFKLAFNIRKVMGDVVDQQNAAVAYASCSSCQTVAISIQVLLVMSDPSVVAPTNVAVAINQNCTLCETLASAYQFVVDVGTAIRLTPEGRRAIERIRKELAGLRKQGLSIEEIQRRTDALMTELGQVLATQITTAKSTDEADDGQDRGSDKADGNQGGGDGNRQDQGSQDSGQPTTSNPTDTTTTPPPDVENPSTSTQSQSPAAAGQTTTPSGTSTTP